MGSWASYHIQNLKSGQTIQFRPKGNSMTPKIESGELVTVTPFRERQEPVQGDIVLCTVSGRQHLHLVSAIRDGQFQISNNKGFVNGWTTLKQIYGKVTKIDP
jgi:phage repressor protein C with HTH and peptisase S24 domain